MPDDTCFVQLSHICSHGDTVADSFCLLRSLSVLQTPQSTRGRGRGRGRGKKAAEEEEEFDDEDEDEMMVMEKAKNKKTAQKVRIEHNIIVLSNCLKVITGAVNYLSHSYSI